MFSHLLLNMSNESFMKKNTYFHTPTFSSKVLIQEYVFVFCLKLKNITYLIFMINSNDDITCFCICCWTWVRFWLNFWFKSIFLYFAIKQDLNSSSIKQMNGEYSLDKVICFAVGSKLMIFSQAQSERKILENAWFCLYWIRNESL